MFDRAIQALDEGTRWGIMMENDVFYAQRMFLEALREACFMSLLIWQENTAAIYNVQRKKQHTNATL